MTQRMFPPRLTRILRQFRRKTDGGIVSIEFLLVLPLMLWAYLGMIIFFDAYRARTQAQSAALHIADLLSRQTTTLTRAELDAMNDVFDFLSNQPRDTRMRVSLITRDEPDDPPRIAWSHGTRGLLPLDTVYQLLGAVDQLATAATGAADGVVDSVVGTVGSTTSNLLGLNLIGQNNSIVNIPEGTVSSSLAPVVQFVNTTLDVITANSGQFADPQYHLPVADIEQRISPVLPGEALILVEAFSAWRTPASEILNMRFLNDMRMSPVAVTRPRFSPFLNYEGAALAFESSGTEMPPVWIPPAPEEEPVIEEERMVVISTRVDTDFSGAVPAGFSQTPVTRTSHPVVGSFLGPFGRETRTNPVTYSVNLGAESRRAVIEFDLLILDSWDGFNRDWSRPEGEQLLLQVNGTTIAAEPFHFGSWGRYAANRRSVASRSEGLFTTTMTRIRTNEHLAGSGGWTDEVWRVTIDVTAPVQNFTLGFAATLDEDIGNESFGLMNFKIVAEQTARNAQHYVPPAASLLGNDPLLTYPVFGGCPETRQAAPFHNIAQTHLADRLEHRVRARGQQVLRDCNLPGIGTPASSVRVHATPTYVLDWTDNNIRSGSNRLRIRTNDNNNGNSCNTILLVREPTGGWRYHVDMSTGPGSGNRNLNSQLEFGWAPAGEYHIWVGSFQLGACDTNLVIERY